MSRRERQGPLSKATKGVAGLIGLAAEAHAHNKNKKSNPAATERQIDDNDSHHATQRQSAESNHRDDASSIYSQPEFASVSGSRVERHLQHPTANIPNLYAEKDENERELYEDEEDNSSLDDMLPPSYDEALSATMPASPSIGTTNTEILPLPLPIIIPQRRPKTHSRGFIHAYSPVLLTHKNISEPQFLDFLHSFHKSTQASPIFRAINIGAMATGMVPSVIAMAVSMSVMAATKAATTYQVKGRTNNFLDKSNGEVFWKVGCHAFITTFQPGRGDERFIDIDSARSRDRIDTQGQAQTQTQAFQLPESAPLVMITTPSSPSGEKSTWTRTKDFTSNYRDKRAQASHPEAFATTTTSSEKPSFTSRYADPNHPVNSGSPIDLLTGGALNLRGDKSRGGLLSSVRDMKTSRSGIDGRSGGSRGQGGRGGLRDRLTSPTPSSSNPNSNSDISQSSRRAGLGVGDVRDRFSRGRNERSSRPSGQLKGVVRKATSMQQDVLYLVIAEIPEDMKGEVRRVLEMEMQMEES